MKWVVLLAALASCTRWRSLAPQDLARYDPDRSPPHVFVVTDAEAFEIDVTSSDQATVHGDVVHAWTLPSPDGVVYEDEGPFEMAGRLRWTALHTTPERVIVPISAVRYARKRHRDARPVLIGVGVGFAVLGVLAFIAVQSLADTWNEAGNE